MSVANIVLRSPQAVANEISTVNLGLLGEGINGWLIRVPVNRGKFALKFVVCRNIYPLGK